MSSFNQDSKWIEAKKVVGNLNWLEIISYYRMVEGSNVFVYAIGDGDKRLIVDVIDDNEVLLVGKSEELIIDTYENIMRSKKMFSYSENYKKRDFVLGGSKITIKLESRE